LIENNKSKDLYLPRKVFDDSIDTAWVEGGKGDGIGEFIILNIDYLKLVKSICIMPGFARNEYLFHANNRPKKLRMILFQSDGKSLDRIQKAKSIEIKNVIKFTEIIFNLKDERKYQCFDVPDYSAIYNKYPSVRMLLEIKSVYRGNKYHDTCISEIKLFDSNGKDLIKPIIDTLKLKYGTNR